MSEYSNPVWEWMTGHRAADKRSSRSGTSPANDYEHIGVDGSEDGSTRPFYGFKFLKDLSGNLGKGVNQFLAGAFPVTFRISLNQNAYGVVYRVRNGSGDCRVFLEYRTSDDATWYGPIDLVGLKDYGLLDMTVVSVGKFVWIFVRGNEPAFFYYDSAIASPFIQVVTDTGAGPSPSLTAEEKNIGWAKTAFNDSLATSQALQTTYVSTDVLGEVAAPGVGEAAARLFMVELNEDTAYWEQDIGGLALTGPSALRKGGGPGTPILSLLPQNDPEFDTVSYFGRVWKSGLSAITSSFSVTLQSEFRFVYQLFDTRTGRRSNYSDFLSRSLYLSGGSNHVGSQDVGRRSVGFPLVEIVYDADKWDTVFFFRTINNSAVYKLDNVITLADYEVVEAYQPAAPFRRSLYFYELTDAQLDGVQSVVDFNVFEEEMPTAGSAIFHEGMMIFGNLATITSKDSGVGVVRFSDPTQVSPELVEPENIYFLQHPGDEIVRFNYANPNIIGLAPQAVYLFRKQNTSIQGYPLKDGYGVVATRASTEVGSSVFYATSTALRAIGADGSVTDVMVCNNIIRREWGGLGGKIKMAYDATANCVYTLLSSEGEVKNAQTTRERLAILWLDTNRMTEVYDATFTHVEKGDVPDDIDADSTTFRRRAVFFQDTFDKEGDYRWRVMVGDWQRERVVSGSTGDDTNGGPRRTLVDITGDSIFSVQAAFNAQTGSTLVLNAGTGAMGTLGDRLEQATVYVLWSATASLIGKSSRIVYKVSGTQLLLQDPFEVNGLAVGDIVGISPVYFRYTSPPISASGGSEDSGGQPFGGSFFRQRVVSTVGAVFGTIDSNMYIAEPEFAAMAKYQGLVWKNDQDSPASRSYPANPGSRSGMPLVSLVENASTVYASAGGTKGIRGGCLCVSIEVFVPDVDFSLLGIKAVGSMGDRTRENLS